MFRLRLRLVFLTLFNDGTEFATIDENGTIGTLQGATGPQGPAGNDGADGSKILTGNGAPAAGLGAVDDFYVDSDAPNNYYTKTGVATWTLQGSLQGEQGIPGPAGGSLAQITVVDILNPTELNAIAGASNGDPIVATQPVAAGINLYGFYFWDSAPSVSENIPYRIDGTGGQWVLNYGFAQDYLFKAQVSTGIVDGLIVTQNANPALVDISAGVMVKVDAYTDPANPVMSFKDIAAVAGVAMTNIATDESTWLSANISGSITQSTARARSRDSKRRASFSCCSSL